MSRRSLWPREHGAYFQLAIPLVVASALGTPSLATLALALAAFLAFLANEPLLVVLGHRGPRMRERDGARARARLLVLALGAAGLGALGLALAPPAALRAGAIAALPGAAVAVLAWHRAEHSLAGELIAAVALTGAALPVMIAGGAALPAGLALWLGWSIGFGAIVIAIHRVLARHRRPAQRRDAAIALGLTAVTVAAARCPALTVAAPLSALATALVITAPSASRLRAIGVATVVVASAAGLWRVLA